MSEQENKPRRGPEPCPCGSGLAYESCCLKDFQDLADKAEEDELLNRFDGCQTEGV